MFLRKLFFVVGFFLLASANCHATTVAEECAKRAKSAYDIGATDKQKETLGNIALSECFKEMEDSLKKGGNSSSNDGSSSDSGGDKGEIAQWFAGLFIGLIGGVGILFIAEIFTRTAMERYRFFRGAMILFGGLVVVLYLVSISTPSLLGPSRSFDLETLVSTIWTLSTIFFVPGLTLNWLRKGAGEEAVKRENKLNNKASKKTAPPSTNATATEKTISELLNAIGARIENMTVAAIASDTGKTERGIRTYLTRHGIKVKDYDGAGKKAQATAK